MLVGGADVNDRGWKTRYFFVEKSSLGVAGKFLRDGWHSSDLRLDSIGPDDEYEEVVNRLYALPVVARTFSKSSVQPLIATPTMASSNISVVVTCCPFFDTVNPW